MTIRLVQVVLDFGQVRLQLVVHPAGHKAFGEECALGAPHVPPDGPIEARTLVILETDVATRALGLVGILEERCHLVFFFLIFVVLSGRKETV